ncbi:MAG TPA: hypothetical protein VII56_22510 [Rhizomicrobium sp.]
MIRTILLAALLGFGLGACTDITLPEPGFLTHAFDSDEAPVSPNACTAAGCPQAPGFCAARGYSPGTVGYQRCIASVEANLRKENK